MKNEFIKKGDSERNIELDEVQDPQTNLEMPVVGPQGDLQLEVPKDDVHT